MIKSTFLFLVLVSAAMANPYDSTLTEASRLLKKSKGISVSMVASLRSVISAKDSTFFQKYFAAHLISASEICTSKNEQTLCPEVENLFKNRIEVGKMLGKKAAYGAARARGDFYFDKGKFDPAAESYEFLTWAPGGQHEYAILKLGWSYLNQKQAKKAFTLWSQELSSALKESQPPSRNLVHGLGVSFSENLSRNADDIKTLNALLLSEDDRQAITEGLLDGLYFLNGPDLKSQWSESVRHLKIYPQLARHMLVDRVNTLLPNCDHLSLLSDKTVFPIFPTSKELRPVISQCVTLYKKNGDKALLESLLSIYANSDLKDTEPFLTWSFYADVAKSPDQACQLGVYWAVHENNSQKVALKEISSACKAASNTKESSNQVVAQVEALAGSVNRHALERPDSSAIALLALLVDQPTIHSDLMAAVTKNPILFTPTLVPTLLAEQLGRQKQWKAVAQFKKTLKFGTEPNKNGSIWTSSARALLVEKIQKKEFAQTLELIRELNIYDQLDQQNLGLLLEWSKVFYSDQKVEVAAMVTRLSGDITQISSLDQYQVLVELLLNLRQDKEVSLVIEKLGIPAKFQLHPAYDAQLFDRVLEKSVDINLSKVKNPQYRKLLFLAQSLSKKAKLTASDFDIKGSTPLHEEMTLVKKIYSKASASQNDKYGSLDKISLWVDFLQTVSAVSKRKWGSFNLLQQGLSQSKETLDYIQANLSKLQANKDISQQEWDKIVSTLQGKVADSKELLNDLSAKAQKTAEGQAP